MVQELSRYLTSEFPYTLDDRDDVELRIQTLERLFVEFTFDVGNPMQEYVDRLEFAQFQLQWPDNEHSYINPEIDNARFRNAEFTRFFLAQTKLFEQGRAAIEQITWMIDVKTNVIMSLREVSLEIVETKIDYQRTFKQTPVGPGHVKDTTVVDYKYQTLSENWFLRILGGESAMLQPQLCGTCEANEMFVCPDCQATVHCSASCASSEQHTCSTL